MYGSVESTKSQTISLTSPGLAVRPDRGPTVTGMESSTDIVPLETEVSPWRLMAEEEPEGTGLHDDNPRKFNIRTTQVKHFQ